MINVLDILSSYFKHIFKLIIMSGLIEVCFVVESNEFKVKGEKLARTSQYYSELLEQSKNFSEIRLLLPEWITLRPFQVYLGYIENARIPKIDLIMAQKILWLADYFKDISLQKNLIFQQIIPFLNRETVLLFVQDACTKVSSTENISEEWVQLYETSCEFAAQNMKYLFHKFSVAISKLDEKAVLCILEKAIKLEDRSYALEKLCEYKNVKDILSLIPLLEKESINQFHLNPDNFIVLEWNIEDFEFSNFYKESPVFQLKSVDWVLCIWCFEHEKRLEISMKHFNPPKELKNQISAVTVAVKFEEDPLESINPQLLPIPVSSPNPSIIKQINNFHPDNTQNVKIQLFAKSEDIVSSILVQLAEYPDLLLNKSVKDLSINTMLVIINFKYLNVKSEDFVLDIMGNWVENIYQFLNDNDIQSLHESINWECVSIEKILQCLRTYPSLKKYNTFKQIIKKQLESKMKKFNSNKYAEDEVVLRKSYKKNYDRQYFSTHKEYLNYIFDLLINVEDKQSV
jgi:hypothetical protein